MNIDFFNSPAYRVPAMRIMRLARLSTIAVLVRVPCLAGSASNSGACSTVKFGSNVGSSVASGRMNMLRTKAICHAFGET